MFHQTSKSIVRVFNQIWKHTDSFNWTDSNRGLQWFQDKLFLIWFFVLKSHFNLCWILFSTLIAYTRRGKNPTTHLKTALETNEKHKVDRKWMLWILVGKIRTITNVIKWRRWNTPRRVCTPLSQIALHYNMRYNRRTKTARQTEKYIHIWTEKYVWLKRLAEDVENGKPN